MLVWTDLETTGLDPRKCSVLEVAAIVTDDQLREIARFERVAYFPNSDDLALLGPDASDEQVQALADTTELHPIVVRMHAKNGLWKACASSRQTLAEVDAEFAEFLKNTSVTDETWQDRKTGETKTGKAKAQLAGSTISFDRGFMAEDLPKALAELHYRNVDVSTLNELARRFWIEVYNARPKREDAAHRGMADIKDSIAVCKHYLAGLAPVVVYKMPADAGNL